MARRIPSLRANFIGWCARQGRNTSRTGVHAHVTQRGGKSKNNPPYFVSRRAQVSHTYDVLVAPARHASRSSPRAFDTSSLTEPLASGTGRMPKKKEEDDDDVSSVDVDEEVNEVEDDEAANDLSNADVVTKYQTAGKIANECLAKVIAAVVPGVKAVALCLVGDEVRLAPRAVPGARRRSRHATRSVLSRRAGDRGGHRQDLQRQGQGRQEDRQGRRRTVRVAVRGLGACASSGRAWRL